MQDNTTPPQQHPEYYLCVPGSGPTSLLATVPAEGNDREVETEIFVTDSEELGKDLRSDDVASVSGVQPMRVFSPSLFTGMVCQVISFLSNPKLY